MLLHRRYTSLSTIYIILSLIILIAGKYIDFAFVITRFPGTRKSFALKSTVVVEILEIVVRNHHRIPDM